MADLADDDAVPLFSRAATGPKMEAIATAKGQIPGSDVLTVPIDFPVQEGQQAPAQTQQIQLAGGPALAALPWLMGGAAVTGGAIAQQQIQQQMKKSQSQQTTVADPQAGKPQVMPGADPSKTQEEQGTPGLEPPKALPPVPGRSSEAPVQGSSFPGQPAEPVAPMEPLDARPFKDGPKTLGKDPVPEVTAGAADSIKNVKLKAAFQGGILSHGTLSGADAKTTNGERDGGEKQGRADFEDMVRRAGGGSFSGYSYSAQPGRSPSIRL